jgi:hypothetical protein
VEELYLPGMLVERVDPTTNMLLANTGMDIPLWTDPLGSLLYQFFLTMARLPPSRLLQCPQ